MRKIMAGMVVVILILGMMSAALADPVAVSTRIKDIAKIQGVRSNQLVGYGLVFGLAGTGDSNKSLETIQSIINMLKSFGVSINAATASQLQSKNVAAVTVTAQLPPFAKPGDTIDVTVSSMGDAKSLQGGTLVQTPLKAANGAVYAVGQGAISVGGYIATGGGSSQQKNFPTAGVIANGGIVERDVPMQFSDGNTIVLDLSQPDFTTANRISDTIQSQFGPIAYARDPGTVVVTVPANYANSVVSFVSALEELPVTPDNIAKVIINERTGTIVMGANVTIDEVAVAQGGITVRITSNPSVSQPAPLAGGNTVVTNSKTVDVNEAPGHVILLPATANVSDVVNALNAVGATPRDMIVILQAMKAAGALHAELQVM